jgi:flagellar operon protein
MDVKKMNTLDTAIKGTQFPSTGIPQGKSVPSTGPSFKDTLDKTSSVDLKKVANDVGLGEKGIKFSNHAIERMQSRGISFKAEDMTKLNEAVDRAAGKGSKDSLILMNDSALIVSVKNRTVVTVMDKTALKENVFTNIDSTIVM